MSDGTHNDRYTKVAIVLHWLIGLCILGQLFLGIYMVDIPKSPPGIRAEYFNLHKSIGLVLIALIIVRIYWRATHKPPALPAHIVSWQVKVSKATHHLLYVLMVLIPLTGLMGSIYSKFPIKFFGTPLPKLAEPDQVLKDFFSDSHIFLTNLLMVILVLHIVAALKHRFIDRDGVFQRMSPCSKCSK
jgi:cytochrome b561